MKTAKYWEERFTQLEAAQNRMGAAAAADIQRAYDRAQRDISDKIKLWYQRFADNNGITMAEAKQWLKGKDLKEFKWDVQEYIRHGEENAIDQQWAKELENASARWHISRYEALKIRMRESLEELSQKYQMSMDDAMSEVYRSGYYHTAFEVAKGVGVGYDIAAIDQSALEKALSKPWAVDGVNFSERIWSNKQKLIDVAYRELTQGIMLGRDPQKTIDAIAKQMNASKSQVGRLVMTEEAYFASASRKDCFSDLGVEKYVIVATLDNRTSEICQEMDGKVFKMSDYQPGVTAPPFHVNCRSTTAPYFEDMQGIVERAARDENGKVYDVPGSMAYKEWKAEFVDRNIKNIAVNESEMQYYKPVRIDEGSERKIKRPGTTVTVRKLVGTDTEIWLSDDAKLKPKQLDFIEKNIANASKMAGVESIPPVIIVSASEMGAGALASYNPIKDMMFMVEEVGDRKKLLELQAGLAKEENTLSTFLHEMLHKAEADRFRRKHGAIDTEFAMDKYLTEVRNRAEAKIEKLSEKEYDDLIKSSKYAEKKIGMGEYEEAYVEMLLLSLLR